jgi:hypothetical protein
MKKLFIVAVLLSTAFGSSAQAFEKGSNYLQAGYGLQLYTLGPICIGYEKGITDVIGIGRFGVGAVLAHEFYYGNSVLLNYVQNRTILMGRCAYHFDFNVEKMDVYAGAAVGIQYHGDYKYKNTGSVSGLYNAGIYPASSVFAGIRYYFTSNFAVYAEAGYGLGYLNGGIVYRF